MTQPVTTTRAAAVQTIAVQKLKNATYSDIYDQPIKLTDGLYQGKSEGGDKAHPVVEYGPELYGDLNGDGVADAVVFLVERTGGTGAFTYVAAQLNQNGQPVDAGAVRIEDRIGIKAASVKDGQVLLEVIMQGPGDVACCGTHQVHKTYALRDGRLAEVSGQAEAPVKISAADLNGTAWTLLEIKQGTPALPEPPITLKFQGDKLSGSGGCNNYTGSFSLDAVNPFAMTIGPLAVTQKSCPDPIGAQETAYLNALKAISHWNYDYGRLAIYYKNGGEELSRLLFAPQAAPAKGPAAPAKGAAATLTRRPWQWVSFTGAVEQFDVAKPESYLVTFNPDGTLNIQADCNRASGTYKSQDGSLTIQVGPMTRAACPPGSRSDQFVKYLGSAARYFFRDGKLYIDLFADGGTMILAPAG